MDDLEFFEIRQKPFGFREVGATMSQLGQYFALPSKMHFSQGDMLARLLQMFLRHCPIHGHLLKVDHAPNL